MYHLKFTTFHALNVQLCLHGTCAAIPPKQCVLSYYGLSHCVPCSYEEAGRYLETYKAYENKPPDLLMERVDSDFTSRVRLQMHVIMLIYFIHMCRHVENHAHNYAPTQLSSLVIQLYVACCSTASDKKSGQGPGTEAA